MSVQAEEMVLAQNNAGTDVIGAITGIVISISIVGYFFPWVGIVFWGIVSSITIFLNFGKVGKDREEEPDRFIDRMSLFPRRAAYMAVPIFLCVGYVVYIGSNSYSGLLRDMARYSNQEQSGSSSGQALGNAAKSLYDNCKVYGKSYDSRC
jgi:hypothetical protein